MSAYDHACMCVCLCVQTCLHVYRSAFVSVSFCACRCVRIYVRLFLSSCFLFVFVFFAYFSACSAESLVAYLLACLCTFVPAWVCVCVCACARVCVSACLQALRAYVLLGCVCASMYVRVGAYHWLCTCVTRTWIFVWIHAYLAPCLRVSGCRCMVFRRPMHVCVRVCACACASVHVRMCAWTSVYVCLPVHAWLHACVRSLCVSLRFSFFSFHLVLLFRSIFVSMICCLIVLYSTFWPSLASFCFCMSLILLLLFSFFFFSMRLCVSSFLFGVSVALCCFLCSSLILFSVCRFSFIFLCFCALFCPTPLRVCHCCFCLVFLCMCVCYFFLDLSGNFFKRGLLKNLGRNSKDFFKVWAFEKSWE